MLNDLANRVLKANVRVMGEPVTLTRPATGATYSFKGIFQESYMTVDPRTGMPVNSAQPILGLNINDIAVEPRRGDDLLIRDTGYRIRDIQEDGHTGMTLLLQRTSARD